MKINIAVNVRHETDGKITPLSIIWEDGRTFDIDRISDIRRAASLKAGGVGMRYTCRIRNKQIYLFDEEGCWFMEG
ncbi:MAG: hypothetical protein A2Y15_06335 [Clostridiales bacterium GWF2_36_10]|nr:MAG: hypothetical protein A2Y15_06335 [Clostridiales bacterium GWF2_36_10]HAN21864.1 hypothetical protein [Clostridiales bacterium]